VKKMKDERVRRDWLFTTLLSCYCPPGRLGGLHGCMAAWLGWAGLIDFKHGARSLRFCFSLSGGNLPSLEKSCFVGKYK
jgi:hypothetical protein